MGWNSDSFYSVYSPMSPRVLSTETFTSSTGFWINYIIISWRTLKIIHIWRHQSQGFLFSWSEAKLWSLLFVSLLLNFQMCHVWETVSESIRYFSYFFLKYFSLKTWRNKIMTSDHAKINVPLLFLWLLFFQRKCCGGKALDCSRRASSANLT